MQHPTGVALPPLDPTGEQKATIETGVSSIKPLPQSSMLDKQSSPYQLNEHVHHTDHSTSTQQGMNGVVPPSHVYVSDPLTLEQQQHLHQQDIMVQLEAQFSQYGIHDHQRQGDHLDSSGHNSNSDMNNIEDMEADDTDEEPVKLFVGQVRMLYCF